MDEEVKGIRYDAKKIVMEIFRRWQALVVIALIVAVVFAVFAIRMGDDVLYEAKMAFSVAYPEVVIEGGEGQNTADLIAYARERQQEKVEQVVDNLINTGYQEAYNMLSAEGSTYVTDNVFRMEEIKDNVEIQLSANSTLITITIHAASAKDAVALLDVYEEITKSRFATDGMKDYSATLSYKHSVEDVKAMFDAVEGTGEKIKNILFAIVGGVVVGFVVAVIILLIYVMVYMRVTYAEDISMQTEFNVLATSYGQENKGALSEACIKSALVRGNVKVTSVLGINTCSSSIAAGLAEREKASKKTLYIDFADQDRAGISEYLQGGELGDLIKEDTLSAGEALDLYDKRDEVKKLIGDLSEKYDRIILSGFGADDARSELVASMSEDEILVIGEGYPIKKLMALEQKFRAEGRNVEGVILQKKEKAGKKTK